MKRPLSAALLFALALCLALWPADTKHTFVRVVDGDTVIVTPDNLRGRLYGIDAPEKG